MKYHKQGLKKDLHHTLKKFNLQPQAPTATRASNNQKIHKTGRCMQSKDSTSQPDLLKSCHNLNGYLGVLVISAYSLQTSSMPSNDDLGQLPQLVGRANFIDSFMA